MQVGDIVQGEACSNLDAVGIIISKSTSPPWAGGPDRIVVCITKSAANNHTDKFQAGSHASTKVSYNLWKVISHASR